MSSDIIKDLESGYDLEAIADIDLDIDGAIKPVESGKIALIDADTIAFTSCLSTEVQEDLLPREMYTDKEYEAVINDPAYDAETNAIWTLNVDVAYEKALGKIERIFDKTGCRECELHFTGGRENFRYKVNASYKGNRSGRAPAGLQKLKEKMLEHHPGVIHTKWEADDIVVYKAMREPEKYTLVAMDKDVLFSVPGVHFNYYERAQSVNKYGNTLEEINMKWMPETTEETVMKWPFMQAIIGDKADNIAGIHGMGEKAAIKTFAGCQTPLECWEALVDVYNSKGKDQIDALQTIRLVHMHQFDGTKIVLWDPRDLV